MRSDRRWTRLLGLALSALGLGCGGRPLDLRVPGGADYATEEPAPPPRDGVTRFFAVGDMGEPHPRDAGKLHPFGVAVAGLVGAACKARGGCQFGAFLGDNVYPNGVHSTAPADPTARRFDDIVATYQAKLGATTPLYFVLGNHDWGPALPSTERADTELEMVRRCGEAGRGCRGSHHFYQFRAGPAEVHVWDTNALVRRCDEGGLDCELDGAETLGRRDACQGADCPVWRIHMGHHPYFSEGGHHDAGAYYEWLFSLWPGRGFKVLMDRYVIGYSDLYLAGHEHSLQVFLDPNPGRPGMGGRQTALVVSGAGVKTSTVTKTRAEYAERRLGFALVEASRDAIVVAMYTLQTGPDRPEFCVKKRRGQASFEVVGEAACTPRP